MATREEDLLKYVYSDELTGLYNRRYLKSHLRGVLQKLRPKNIPLSILIIDIDHFKQVNDSFGHLAGDQLLLGFSTILKKLAAKKAIPIRYAGDEFVVVMPNHDKKVGKEFGEKLLQILKSNKVKISDEQSLYMSASIGVAAFPKDAQVYEDLFKRADDALYRAKELGRARVAVYPDDEKMISPDLVSSLLPPAEPVGRETEASFLLEYIQSEPKEMPFLLGESGKGKTYLLNWLEKKAENLGISAFCITGHAFRKFQPLAAVFAALDHFREKSISRFEKILSQLPKEHKRAILDRLDLEKSEEMFSPDSVVSAVTAFLLEALSLGKMLFTVDEMQEVDDDSMRFVSTFLNQFEEKPVYPVMASQSSPQQPAEMVRVMSMIPELQHRVKYFELREFSQEDTRTYFTRVLGENPFEETHLQLLLENSKGVPLYVQETLANLLSTGKLEYDVDHWVLRSLEDSDFTMSSLNLAHSRIKSLPDEVRQVLSLAAVIGESFDVPVLSELTEKNENDLGDLLRAAEEAHMLVEAPQHEGDFKFSNLSEKEALAELISSEERQKLHGKIIEIKKRLRLGHSNLALGRLVYHLLQASMWAQAAEVHEQMATSFIEGHLSDAALEQLQRSTMTRIQAREMPLSEDDLMRAGKTARALKIALQNLRLYPPTNENVRASIQSVYDELIYFFSKTEAFTINATPDALLINGSEPKSKELGNVAEEMYEFMNGLDLHGIMFIKGMTIDELSAFLEIASHTKPGQADAWNLELKDRNIEHILPDRKVYVTVGETKIDMEAGDKIVVGQTPESVAEEVAETGVESAPFAQDLVTKLRRESERIIQAINAGGGALPELNQFKELVEQLRKDVAIDQADSMQILGDATEKEIRMTPMPDDEAADFLDDDVWNTFEALSSSNSKHRSLAAGKLLSLKEDLPKMVFQFIDEDRPISIARRAALLVKKQGPDSEKAFLSYIKPGLPEKKIRALLRVADVFSENNLTYNKISEIIPQSYSPSLLKDFERFIFQAPAGKADNAIIALFEICDDADKPRVLKMAGMVGVKGLLPYLKKLLARPRNWEIALHKELAIEAARAAHHVLERDKTVINLLLDLVKPPRTLQFKKKVPEDIRVAALWALGQIRPPELSSMLVKLSNDPQERVALQAKHIMAEGS
jgi:diguanylate cyclase (GGDEF)-like protein